MYLWEPKYWNAAIAAAMASGQRTRRRRRRVWLSLPFISLQVSPFSVLLEVNPAWGETRTSANCPPDGSVAFLAHRTLSAKVLVTNASTLLETSFSSELAMQ